jgi:hypothetical protein
VIAIDQGQKLSFGRLYDEYHDITAVPADFFDYFVERRHALAVMRQ